MKARLFTEENRRSRTLAALAFALFMIMLDNTVVNVALPAIQRDLRMGLSELESTVNAYALTFAVLMLSGGKLADYFGRRRIFLTGLAIFTVASLACGFAATGGVRIGARTVQGVGAALMMPATLSIISATFPPRQRGAAIGIWAGVSAMALAIGPLVGGLLTERINWSWIFFVNVPVGVLGLVAGWEILPGLVVGGLGMAMTMTPMTSAALGSVPVAKSGVGSGVLNTSRQIGGALGIAVMGAIVTTEMTSALESGATKPEAFVEGFSTALLVGAGVALAAAVVAAVSVRKYRPIKPSDLAEAAA